MASDQKTISDKTIKDSKEVNPSVTLDSQLKEAEIAEKTALVNKTTDLGKVAVKSSLDKIRSAKIREAAQKAAEKKLDNESVKLSALLASRSITEVFDQNDITILKAEAGAQDDIDAYIKEQAAEIWQTSKKSAGVNTTSKDSYDIIAGKKKMTQKEIDESQAKQKREIEKEVREEVSTSLTKKSSSLSKTTDSKITSIGSKLGLSASKTSKLSGKLTAKINIKTEELTTRMSANISDAITSRISDDILKQYAENMKKIEEVQKIKNQIALAKAMKKEIIKNAEAAAMAAAKAAVEKAVKNYVSKKLAENQQKKTKTGG